MSAASDAVAWHAAPSLHRSLTPPACFFNRANADPIYFRVQYEDGDAEDVSEHNLPGILIAGVATTITDQRTNVAKEMLKTKKRKRQQPRWQQQYQAEPVLAAAATLKSAGPRRLRDTAADGRKKKRKKAIQWQTTHEWVGREVVRLYKLQNKQGVEIRSRKPYFGRVVAYSPRTNKSGATRAVWQILIESGGNGEKNGAKEVVGEVDLIRAFAEVCRFRDEKTIARRRTAINNRMEILELRNRADARALELNRSSHVDEKVAAEKLARAEDGMPAQPAAVPKRGDGNENRSSSGSDTDNDTDTDSDSESDSDSDGGGGGSSSSSSSSHTPADEQLARVLGGEVPAADFQRELLHPERRRLLGKLALRGQVVADLEVLRGEQAAALVGLAAAGGGRFGLRRIALQDLRRRRHLRAPPPSRGQASGLRGPPRPQGPVLTRGRGGHVSTLAFRLTKKGVSFGNRREGLWQARSLGSTGQLQRRRCVMAEPTSCSDNPIVISGC